MGKRMLSYTGFVRLVSNRRPYSWVWDSGSWLVRWSLSADRITGTWLLPPKCNHHPPLSPSTQCSTPRTSSNTKKVSAWYGALPVLHLQIPPHYCALMDPPRPWVVLVLTVYRLAATLGSKSSLKRLQKRQILSVDVAEACTYLANPPDEPLALRLSSNLMFGVTRVFSQQYNFFYSTRSQSSSSLLQLSYSSQMQRFSPLFFFMCRFGFFSLTA